VKSMLSVWKSARLDKRYFVRAFINFCHRKTRCTGVRKRARAAGVRHMKFEGKGLTQALS
jgi:hypothetical protein